MQANTVKPKPRPTQGSQTGIYKVDSIKVEYLFQNDLVLTFTFEQGHCRFLEYNVI